MPSTRRPSASTARKRLAAPERDARTRWRPSRTTRLRTVVGARSPPGAERLEAGRGHDVRVARDVVKSAAGGVDWHGAVAQPRPHPVDLLPARSLAADRGRADTDRARPGARRRQRGPRAGAYRHIARFGANPPETVEELRTETGCDVLVACGLSAVLFNQSADGTSRCEAYRQALHIGIRPVVRLVTAEFRAKLDAPGLEIDRSDLHTAGRVRSFKQLVEAGVDPVDAAEVTGITPDTTDSRPAAERAAGAGR